MWWKYYIFFSTSTFFITTTTSSRLCEFEKPNGLRNCQNRPALYTDITTTATEPLTTQEIEATPSIKVNSRFGQPEPYQAGAPPPHRIQLHQYKQDKQLYLLELSRQTAYSNSQQTIQTANQRGPQIVTENRSAQQYTQQQYANQNTQRIYPQQQIRPASRSAIPTQLPHVAQVSHQPPPIQYQNGPQPIKSGFTNSLHQIISSNNPALNVVYSPISLQIALALIYTGASGQTAQELRAALNLPEDKNKVLEIFQSIPKSRQSGEFVLSLVSKLFYNKNLQVANQFVSNARTYFDADASPVNFGSTQATASQINQWVAIKTNQRIRDIITPKELGSRTSAILVNAIYFKAKWYNEFSSDETTDDVFSVAPNQNVPVRMMNNLDTFRYADMPNYHARVLQLSYKDTDMSMMIILPYEVNGLASMEARFENYDLRNLLQEVRPETVRVQLPKFRVEFELDMVEALKRLNIKTLFTNFAELYDIFQNSAAGISSVKHKAFIDVNEAGTEAAAVTYTKFIPLSLPSNIKEFRVDHPFMYAIISPQAVYFAGHVVRF